MSKRNAYSPKHVGPSHASFGEMCWPRPLGEKEWEALTCDRAPSESTVRLLKSVASAYHALIFKTDAERSKICRTLRDVEDAELRKRLEAGRGDE